MDAPNNESIKQKQSPKQNIQMVSCGYLWSAVDTCGQLWLLVA